MKILKLLILLPFLFCPILSNATLPQLFSMQQKPSLSHMLKQALPGVVNIVSQGELPIPNDPFLRRELEQQQHGASVEQNKHFVSVGSGVIIDAEHGLIITNAHVVNLARNITVTLNDGRHFQAKKIGEDDTTDIAVLQINATDLTSIPFGDSNKLVVGDFVAAIGSPLGLKQSVTSGIVSALHRSDLGIEGLENFIQTDAPINMGNSGGALMNMDGQLVGINTALLSGSGGNIGIGFAIPSNMAKSVVAQILEFGKVQRGLMGVLVQTLSPDLAAALHTPRQKGAIISQIVPYSPAAHAGLKVGDIIIFINKEAITSSEDVQNTVGLMRVGETAKVTVLRQQKQYSFTVKTSDPKISLTMAQKENPFLYGLELANFTEENTAHGYVQGIKVLKVNNYCTAWTAGLREDDIIVSANNQLVHNISQLKTIAHGNTKNLLLNILRDKGAAFVVIK